jgi:hypothetical protein
MNTLRNNLIQELQAAQDRVSRLQQMIALYRGTGTLPSASSTGLVGTAKEGTTRF